MIGASGLATELYCPYCQEYGGFRVGTHFAAVTCEKCGRVYAVEGGQEMAETPKQTSEHAAWNRARREHEKEVRATALKAGRGRRKATEVKVRQVMCKACWGAKCEKCDWEGFVKVEEVARVEYE